MREIKHLSVHQWLRSAIPDSQQPTSPIGFLFLKLPPPPCAVLLVILKKKENIIIRLNQNHHRHPHPHPYRHRHHRHHHHHHNCRHHHHPRRHRCYIMSDFLVYFGIKSNKSSHWSLTLKYTYRVTHLHLFRHDLVQSSNSLQDLVESKKSQPR